MSKGDIWVVDLPAGIENEQAMPRPSIVVAEITRYRLAVIVPLTKSMNTAAAPFTVVLQPSIGNGLAVQSVALVNQILTVNMKRFRGNRKGTLNPSELATVDSQLKAMLQL